MDKITDDMFKEIIEKSTNWEDICKKFNILKVNRDLQTKIKRLNINCSHINETYIDYNKKINSEYLGNISEEKLIEIVKNAKNWNDIIIGCGLKHMNRNLQKRLDKIDHSHLPQNFGGLYSKLGKYSKEYYEEIVKKSKSWDEILEILKYSSTLFIKTIKKYFDQYEINYIHLTYPEKLSNKMKIELKDILVENSTYNNGKALKKRLKEELGWEHKCAHCYQSIFSNCNVKDVPIPLEVDHISGNHFDNRIENLRLLCPTCHALTDTYKGKNMAVTKINKENPKVDKENIIKKLFLRKCIDCNIDMVRKNTRCVNCNIKYNFQKYLEKYPMIPSYDQLKKDLNVLEHYTQIGKKYKLSPKIISEIFYKYKLINNEIILDTNEEIVEKDTNEIIIDTKKEEKTIKCIDCDNLISKKATRCIICNDTHKFKEASYDRPSYEQLKKDMEELKFYTTIGKKYNVSDNCIRKWIRKYEKYNL